MPGFFRAELGMTCHEKFGLGKKWTGGPFLA
jgi:hypothetical protein